MYETKRTEPIETITIETIYTRGIDKNVILKEDHLPFEEYKSMIESVKERIKEDVGLHSDLDLKIGFFLQEEIEKSRFDYNAILKLYIPRIFGFLREEQFYVNISNLGLRDENGEIIRGPFYALRMTENYINSLEQKENPKSELEIKVRSIKSIMDKEGFFDVDPKADLLSLIKRE